MVAQDSNSSIQETEAWAGEFKVKLGYIAIFCLKKAKEKKQKPNINILCEHMCKSSKLNVMIFNQNNLSQANLFQ